MNGLVVWHFAMNIWSPVGIEKRYSVLVFN